MLRQGFHNTVELTERELRDLEFEQQAEIMQNTNEIAKYSEILAEQVDKHGSILMAVLVILIFDSARETVEFIRWAVPGVFQWLTGL
jgi:hypothetical protein